MPKLRRISGFTTVAALAAITASTAALAASLIFGASGPVTLADMTWDQKSPSPAAPVAPGVTNR